MKMTSSFRMLAMAVAGLAMAGLTSCASPRERRIVNNPELFQRLSANDRTLVSQGGIREGMTKEAVFLALGRPDHVAEGRDRGSAVERWTYLGSRPVYTSSVGFGWGTGRYYGGGLGIGYGGMWDPYWGGYGSGVSYLPYPAATVEFRSGRVVRYLREPQ